MRYVCVAVLACSLSGAPALAQTVRDPRPAVRDPRPVRPLQDAIRHEAVALAAQSTAGQKGRIPPAYLWTGVGLLGGAGLYFIGAALYDPCADIVGGIVISCESLVSTVTYATGVALAAAGATVLILGNNKRQVSPALLPAPRGVGLGGRITF